MTYKEIVGNLTSRPAIAAQPCERDEMLIRYLNKSVESIATPMPSPTALRTHWSRCMRLFAVMANAGRGVESSPVVDAHRAFKTRLRNGRRL